MTATVGLAMIVRDEEANLPGCLASVAGQVDEIVVVDTGSSDRTVDVARQFTDKVYHFSWNGDFSAARNYALERVESDWILSLDADEQLDVAGGDLRTLVEGSRGREAYFLPLHHLLADLPGDYNRYLVLRLFRNLKEYRFRGAIHEQVPVARPEAVDVADHPVIWHKVVTGRDHQRKHQRNLGLLQKEAAANPANPFLQYYLGVEWLGLGKPTRALPCFQRACAELDDSHLLFRAPAVRYLVSCFRALNRLDEGFCLCLEGAARYPDYTDLFFEGGMLLEARGDYAVAVRWFEEAVKCGTPPAVFAHTKGTSSHLAFYHLGHCHEKLSRLPRARDYYQQALSANPECVYPLYNFFLLELAGRGPREAYDVFLHAGHLQRPAWARVIADLFALAGFPDLALACLREGRLGREPEDLTRLARFRLRAGQPQGALAALEHLNRAGQAPQADGVDEILAWAAKGDLAQAKARAMALWRRPDSRSAAAAILSLLARLSRTPQKILLERPREPAAIRTALAVLDRGQAYQELVKAAMGFLIDLSPEGSRDLCDYLKARGDSVRQLRDFRFGRAGGLSP